MDYQRPPAPHSQYHPPEFPYSVVPSFQYQPPVSTYLVTPNFQYYPQVPPPNSMGPSSAFFDKERYVADLLSERERLGQFMHFLNQEIMRVSGLPSKEYFLPSDRLDYASHSRLAGHQSIGGPMYSEGCSRMHTEDPGYYPGFGNFHASPGVPVIMGTRIVRLDVPVEKYPNYNFIGRLLGPQGNSLKRLEATTHCRVYLRGWGSWSDPVMEEMLRGKPGYEHLNEQLHVIVVAELPQDIVEEKLNQAVETIQNIINPEYEFVDHSKKKPDEGCSSAKSPQRIDNP